MSEEYIHRMTRRRIGLDALHRLRRLVDAERTREASDARLARRLTVVLAVLAGLTFLYLLSL